MDYLEPLPDFDEKEVNADAFFGEIAARLTAHFRQAGTRVSIHVDAQIVDIPVTLAEDLGRIAEELLDNACTYGRSADGSVTAWLSFHIHRNLVHLTVEDEGPGWPEGFDLERIGSGGFGRMNAFVQSHSGVVRWSNLKGAKVTICLPQPAPQDLRRTPVVIHDELHARREARNQRR